MAARPARTHLLTRTGRASSGVDEVLAIALARSSGAKLVLPHHLDPITNMTPHLHIHSDKAQQLELSTRSRPRG